MRKILLYLSLLSLLFTLSTCKKYPEDPFISLRTVKMRLEGEWQLESIEINGEDAGFKYNDSLAPLTFTDYKFWFSFGAKIDNSSQKYNLFLINKSSKSEESALNSIDVSGTRFSIYPTKDKDLLIANSFDQIAIKDSNSSGILLNLLADNILSGAVVWQIKKLYKKELILQKEKKGILYRIKLKKTRKK